MFAFLPYSSPWLDNEAVTSRSITAENPTGQKGSGGRAASALGPGRKGRPCVPLEAGETITLADISGSGCITRLWLTVPDRTEASPFVLRDLVLRAYWDEAVAPSIEVPLGDFFCNGFGAPLHGELVADRRGADGGDEQLFSDALPAAGTSYPRERASRSCRLRVLPS